MIQLYKYRLPFRSPFHSGGRSYNDREGAVIRYTGSGIDIVSEAAPLKGFSTETLDDVLTVLKQQKQEIGAFLYAVSGPNQLRQFLADKQYSPSISFALSCLALDLIFLHNPDAQKRSESAHRKQISVNAVTGIRNESDLSAKIAQIYHEGFRTVKIKSGPDPLAAARCIEKSASRFSDLVFRIDANRSWKKREIPSILEHFRNLPVEYCEEPCTFNNFKEFLHLKTSSPVPLALDESIKDIRMLNEIISKKITDIVILKPMLLGSVMELIETFSLSVSSEIDRVCTTTLESGIGRAAVSKLAAVIGSGQLAQGLSTGRLLKEDLADRYEIDHGAVEVNVNDSWCMDFNRCNPGKLLKVDD
jgi:o-succinylbenzoate synthase